MTKADLEAELEKLERSNASLRGQITKMRGAAPSDEFTAAVRTLVNKIDALGLSVQIGNRGEVAAVRAFI